MIVVQTVVDAPLDAVWSAYVTPEDVMQWNAASEDWHTPSASNDLRVGGTFCYRMEAKDGSMGFDFEGTFTHVTPLEQLAYDLGGRQVDVRFQSTDSGVQVRIEFESDGEHSEDLQRAGWQAILDNFRRLVESRS